MRRRLKISRRDKRYVLVFLVAAMIATSSAALYALNPAPSEHFFALWVLGSHGLTENYYPNDDPNLSVGDGVSWTLGVYNHMGSVEYVVVRVKLLNLTQRSPDATTGNPSPVPPLFEFTRVLLDNETWSIPFEWKITQVAQIGRSLVLSGLSLNRTLLNGQLASAVSGFNFRFVFELWLYDQNANDLVFSWHTAGTQHSAWVQIWFNVTATP